MNKEKYVLITPARNEEEFINKTIESVIGQTVLPIKWVIVSDGSTDSTDEIVKKYSAKHAFIRLVRIKGHRKRTFSSKVNAFNVGYNELKNTEYDYIGLLDADISFDPSYYESVLQKFHNNSRLGIAGGIRYDFYRGTFRKVYCAKNSVGGPIQMFRRQCYEEIGGFTPLDIGGEDAVIETKARMHGWEVETFPEIKVYHHRLTGCANHNIIVAEFRAGIRNYVLGYHPIFELFRCILRILEKPYFIRSICLLSGYFWASIRRYNRPLSDEFVDYLRAEQIKRLRAILIKPENPLI